MIFFCFSVHFLKATLHANGDIVFVYVHIPEVLRVDALYDDEPVAGLSDAFLVMLERSVSLITSYNNKKSLLEVVIIFILSTLRSTIQSFTSTTRSTLTIH